MAKSTSRIPLTKAQSERLAFLQEECAEIIKICSKIERHGQHSFNPNDPRQTTNTELLMEEIGDLYFAVKLLTASHDLSDEGIHEYFIERLNGKGHQYFYFQDTTFKEIQP